MEILEQSSPLASHIARFESHESQENQAGHESAREVSTHILSSARLGSAHDKSAQKQENQAAAPRLQADRNTCYLQPPRPTVATSPSRVIGLSPNEA
jgi:hypothetical protein